MRAVTRRRFWQVFLASTVVAAVLAFYQTVEQAQALGVSFRESKWPFFLGILSVNVVAGSLGIRRPAGGVVERWLHRLDARSGSGKAAAIGIAMIAAAFAMVWLIRLLLQQSLLPGIFPFLWCFLWLSLGEAAGLGLLIRRDWHVRLAAVLLGQAVLFHIYGHLAVATAFPFSVGYSEAGRHYYASLFFAPSLYGVQPPLPFLHPSRYLLLSVPFLFQGLPLVAHRLWQALLWLGLTGLASFGVVRRLRLRGRWLTLLLGAWAFATFLQGAVYYHLHVSVIIVLFGVSSKRPWRSLLAVVLASLWAGISRINWLPVPAILAILLYVLETPIRRPATRYWSSPILWGAVGILAASSAQATYAAIAGTEDLKAFGSSLMSTLLWNRLLPNETFGPGVLLGIIIVAAPLVLGIWQMLGSRSDQIAAARRLVTLAILVVLLVGGIIVSVKIGGGADLHNLDAFIVSLVLVAAYIYAGRVTAEVSRPRAWGELPWPVVYLAVLIPTVFSLSQVQAPFSYSPSLAKSDIRVLQESTSDAVRTGGEVLFVSERQVLTFQDIVGVPLIPEYEQMELMEMAMSRNADYLQRFYADLERHRFALVVAEEQKFTRRQRGAFGEENSAWVRFVGAPLLCAYKPIASLASANVQIFEPRPRAPDCKDPFQE